jgi:hypothetical protein
MSLVGKSEASPVPERPVLDSNNAAAFVEPPLVARGIFGHVELGNGEIRIVRHTALGHLVDLIWYAYGVQEKRIPLSAVSSIEIIRPLILPDIFRVTYAGGPPQSGHYFRDALAENALMMNMFDNRRFYEIRDRITQLTAFGRARVPPAPTRRRRRGL